MQDEEAYFSSDGDDEDEGEHHINARIDQLRAGHPPIEGPPLPQPTANGGEPTAMGLRNPFGLVDYEDEDEESPPGSSDGNGLGPHARQENHPPAPPHLWPGAQQRTGVWGDGLALKRGPLMREGVLAFPNGSNFERGPLRVARRMSPGRDHGSRRREMELSLEREDYEEKMKRRRMMAGKANGDAAAEEARRGPKERGWKSTRSKWREHLLKRERHALDGLRPGLAPMEEDASQTLQGLGERIVSPGGEPQQVQDGGEQGSAGTGGERPEEAMRPETAAHDILMGVDLSSIEALETGGLREGAFAVQEKAEIADSRDAKFAGPLGSTAEEGPPGEVIQQIAVEEAGPATVENAGDGSADGPFRDMPAGEGPQEVGAARDDWQGGLDFQSDHTTSKESDSKLKLDSERGSQELLGLGSDLARGNPTPEPYEVR